MSDQKLSAVVREAMWIAHSKKCAYTRELIDLGSMHIDHIIPERLASTPAEFTRVRLALGLSDDFDLWGLGNLLPVKPECNLQKMDMTLNRASAHFFLNVAAQKRPEIERNIEQIKRRIESGRALITLQQLIESGAVQTLNVAPLLSDSKEEIFRLAAALEFADNGHVASIGKGELAELRDRPFDNRELRLWKGAEVIHVRSCAEYEAARRAGFEPNCNVDIKASVFYEHRCSLLSALGRATLPMQSHLAEPRVGVSDLHLLPISLFPDLPADVSRQQNNVSYEHKVASHELVVKRVRSGLLLIEEPEGMGQQLVEVVRADFDGDGLEEILVFEYCYATHGTLGFGGVLLLSRRRSDGLFEFSRL